MAHDPVTVVLREWGQLAESAYLVRNTSTNPTTQDGRCAPVSEGAATFGETGCGQGRKVSCPAESAPGKALGRGPGRRVVGGPLLLEESRVSTEPAASEAPVIAFRDAAEFEAWLGAHVGLRAGVWLKIAKKASGRPSLTDDEAVGLGLCF